MYLSSTSSSFKHSSLGRWVKGKRKIKWWILSACWTWDNTYKFNDWRFYSWNLHNCWPHIPGWWLYGYAEIFCWIICCGFTTVWFGFPHCSCSVEGGVIESKAFSGKEMDMFFCTNELKAGASGGPGNRSPWLSFPHSNTAGLWRWIIRTKWATQYAGESHLLFAWLNIPHQMYWLFAESVLRICRGAPDVL